RSKGSATATVKLYAGMRLPEGNSPPESTVSREISFPVDVVGWGTLRVKTDQPARVYVVGSDGLSYAPAGALARITWSAGDYFYYTRGEDEIWLPEGRASIEAVRGFEYAPATATAEIAEGRHSDARLVLERRENLPFDGWYSGDVHIHANYNNHEFITPEDVRDQIQAEDLNVANMMVANSSGPHIHDEQYFEGRPNKVSTPQHIVYWVEEMRNAGLYGHMCLIGLKSLVKPQHTGFANSAWPWDYPPNHVQAVEANRQGGAATYPHPGYNFTADPQTMSARELPVDLALGSINAMDVLSNANEDASTPMWYRLLNTGLKCAISAGTDSFTNRRHHWLPGAERVYVYVPGQFDYQSWVDNYKAGRSFATNGPIVRFTVEGKGPGDEVRLSAPGSVTANASVTSYLPFDTLELVANGKVVATAKPDSSGRAARLRHSYKLERSAWLAARVRGPYHRLVTNDRFLYAHTSPVYCLVGQEKIGNREDAQFFVAWIDKLIAMAEQRGRYANEQQKREVVDLFRKGRKYYEGVSGR
ncbi:MAG: CehA/McbA family metallohydrolase, partial [Acidobacteria bacterium]|nr:CehA/McbA family metallohydrolase [Acidobacteriota bacterium]